jgi:glycosyltransferase involved in cell wall biosynthesis
MAEKKEFSIVVPVFNEENNVVLLTEKINAALEGNYNYEIIFINDGSTDNTQIDLENLAHKYDRVGYVKFRRNYGKAAAYAAGLKHAKSDIIITMDGDLQDDPAEIPKFLDKLEQGADYVSGWKFEGKGNPYRAWPSKFFNSVVRRFTKIKLNDFNCPFKAFKKGVVESSEIYGELYRFLPVLANIKGYKIEEIPVKNYPRTHGKSKYGLERFLRGFFDLLTISFLSRYFYRPLHFIGGVGLLFLILGTLIITILYLLKFLFGFLIQNTPFLFTLGVLTILIGIQFISFGLVSELVIKMFSKQSGDIYYEEKSRFAKIDFTK